MKYARLRWKHDFPDEPIIYYIEIDDERWEQRAVVVYRDGSTVYAVRGGEDTGAHLGEDPLPELSEIAKDPEFEATDITQEVFEAQWTDRNAAQPQQRSKNKKTRRAPRPARS